MNLNSWSPTARYTALVPTVSRIEFVVYAGSMVLLATAVLGLLLGWHKGDIK